jgi:hypothetical protein
MKGDATNEPTYLFATIGSLVEKGASLRAGPVHCYQGDIGGVPYFIGIADGVRTKGTAIRTANYPRSIHKPQTNIRSIKTVKLYAVGSNRECCA